MSAFIVMSLYLLNARYALLDTNAQVDSLLHHVIRAIIVYPGKRDVRFVLQVINAQIQLCLYSKGVLWELTQLEDNKNAHLAQQGMVVMQ
jgi:hypothetical protein